MKRRMIHADEYDAFTKWRNVHFWQNGELRKIKRRANKRERREAKQAMIRLICLLTRRHTWRPAGYKARACRRCHKYQWIVR